MKTIHYSFWKRLWFAWKAYNLEPFEAVYAPFHKEADLRRDFYIPCDNERQSINCQGKGVVAMTRTMIEFRITEPDNFFCCHSCAIKVEGKIDRWKTFQQPGDQPHLEF